MTKYNNQLVSVIIPAWNSEAWIVETLNSVFNQTWKHLEVIVIDDGSTDSTGILIRQNFPNVRYIYQENSGQAAARNRGVIESHGEYLAFLDSDDLWLPEKIEAQMDLIFEREDISLVFCDYDSFGTNPGLSGFERGPVLKSLQTTSLGDKGWLIETTDLFSPMLRDMYCQIPSSWLTTRFFFNSIGGFDEELRNGGEDWLFALKLSRRGRLAFDSRRLLMRREHKNSHSKCHNESIGIAEALSKLISSTHDLPDESVAFLRERLAFSCLYIGQTEAINKRDASRWFSAAINHAKFLPIFDKLKINLKALLGLLTTKSQKIH